ncbi:MAG TPA: cyclic nucleotide-binding domain-containing protein [Usitatibacter sp.]|jgi:CRP-like cAMP-binding protein|nr:cyclic nucleotide-binding domain-containing protein [Usitatibacter sp.]
MDDKLTIFATEENPRACEPGETIFQAYDMGSEMYVVIEGQVELRIGDKTIETLGPGEPFGEMALIDQAPRTATAIARTACKLAVIPEKRFLFMVAQTPHFALQIMKVMADRLRKMNARAEL